MTILNILAGVAGTFVLAFLGWLYALGRSTGRVDAELKAKTDAADATKRATEELVRYRTRSTVVERMRDDEVEF